MPKSAKAPAVVFVTKNPTPSATGIPSPKFEENFAELEEPEVPSPFTRMAETLESLARPNDLHKTAVFDKAAGLPGLDAHEISKLEAMRNRADSRAQQKGK